MSIVTPVPPEQETLAPQPRPHRVGALHLSQLLLVEAVVLVVAVAAGLGAVPAAGLGMAGLPLIVLVFRRRGRRWAMEWRLLRWRLARRTRDTAAQAHPDPRIAALRTVAPSLNVSDRQTADGLPAGIGGDRAGWFAVLESAGTTEHLAQEQPGPPLDRLDRLVAESDIPGVRVQVLTHTVPSALDDDRARALGAHVSVLTRVTTWVVIRLDARALAEEARSDAVSPPDVLLTLVRRVETLLRRSTRATWRVVDADGLTAALARSCGLGEYPRLTEELDRVSTESLNHVTFWVRSWPAAGEPRVLIDALSLVPAAFTSVSIVLEPAPAGTRMRCLVRITTGAGELGTAVDTVHQVSRQLEADVQRLDAEQGPALYATAPSGGGVG